MPTDKELAVFFTDIWRTNASEEEVALIGDSGYSPSSNFIQSKVAELKALFAPKEPSDEDADSIFHEFYGDGFKPCEKDRNFVRECTKRFGGVRVPKEITLNVLNEKLDELRERETTDSITDALDIALWVMNEHYPDFAAAEAKITRLEEALIEMHAIAAEQMRTAEQRDVEIQELKNKERRYFCEYCGELISFGSQDEVDKNLAAAMEHVKNCPKNPSISRIAELEAALSKANDELRSKVIETLELLKKLQEEPTVGILFGMLAEIDQLRGEKSVCLNMFSDGRSILRYGGLGKFHLESSEVDAFAIDGSKCSTLAETLTAYISFLKAPIAEQLEFAQGRRGDGMLLDVATRINPNSLRVPATTTEPAPESTSPEAAA